MLVLACEVGVVALLDVDRRCDGPLSSSTPRVRMLYHATVVVPLSSLVSWDGGGGRIELSSALLNGISPNLLTDRYGNDTQLRTVEGLCLLPNC